MDFDEYRRFDAVGLAELVAKGEVTAGELLETALARTQAVNPALNAVIALCLEEARAAAADAAGPLGGVPFLIKDIGARMRGMRTAAGSRVFAGAPEAAEDSALIAAYRRAGLVLFGKTNTPEFGLACVTEPVARGPTRNPWSAAHTAGGSSGGSAAAVAAGIVPAAHASDGGGSIRIPAACCGLFGLKPSRGRVSAAPDVEGWGGLSVQHAVTRSVRDSAALLDAACEPQPGDPYPLARPAVPFAQEVSRDPGRLRIGVFAGGLSWPSIDAECAAAVQDAARLCESLGHQVEEWRPDLDFVAMSQAAGIVISASVAAMLEAEAAARGRPIGEEEVEAVTWLIHHNGKAASAVEHAGALQFLALFTRRLARVFEAYDVLLLSTLGKPPVPAGSIDTNAADLSDYAERLYSFIPNTQAFNVGGQPAMSVPLAWSRQGLPIGVQFAAAHGEEATLFRLAGQLEQARPWFGKIPVGA